MERNAISSALGGTGCNSHYLRNFRTINKLGRGGFGHVLKALNVIDRTDYAVKLIPLTNSLEDEAKATREARALAVLNHPHIVRYYQAWIEDLPLSVKKVIGYVSSEDSSEGFSSGNMSNYSMRMASDDYYEGNHDSSLSSTSSLRIGNNNDLSCEDINQLEQLRRLQISDRNVVETTKTFLFIQMELCGDMNLQNWIEINVDRTIDDVIRYQKSIIEAVEYIHLKGFIHRDLKPTNIFFSLNGTIKVGDFGLAKEIVLVYNKETIDAADKHSSGVGTELYMSPEQLESKDYGSEVDIYAMGIIWVELLVPFKTQMERVVSLRNLRENVFPDKFAMYYPRELLSNMKWMCFVSANIGWRMKKSCNLAEILATYYI